MWWPRLLSGHAAIQWDDYEKDYSDLPPQVYLLSDPAASTICYKQHACSLFSAVVVAVATDIQNAKGLKSSACQT